MYCPAISEQEGDYNNKTTCIEEIWQEFPSFNQYEVRSAPCQMRPDYQAHIESQVRVLTGGASRRRSACVCPINRDTNVLLLDEPTNHLDDAKDALKEAPLGNLGGNLLLHLP